MRHFLLSFIPIFVAMDAIGILPIYIGFTEHLKPRERKSVVNQSIVTAFLIGVVFLFLGQWIFKILGVMVFDFKIAGGLVLLVIALRDLLQNDKGYRIPKDTVGAVPIGTPLIVGPAVLTTIIMMLDSYGSVLTVTSFVANLFLTWMVLLYSNTISKFLGKAGSKAVSKITHLLLAAIAVMMMRKGIVDAIAYFLTQKPG
jgi:multiple antibiotic resistance protein